MTPQFVFMVLGIVAFIAAAILGVLAFVTYRNEDIRAVKDDLSGKSRRRDIEEGRDKRPDPRSSKRKAGEVSGMSGLYEDAPTDRGARKIRKKTAQKQMSADQSRKRAGADKPFAGSAGKEASKSADRKRPKSVEEYQAEYADDTGELTWGAIIPPNLGQSSKASAFPETETTAEHIEGNAQFEAVASIPARRRDISFKVIRKEVSVHSEKVIGE